MEPHGIEIWKKAAPKNKPWLVYTHNTQFDHYKLEGYYKWEWVANLMAKLAQGSSMPVAQSTDEPKSFVVNCKR